jgi:hypothetical protein
VDVDHLSSDNYKKKEHVHEVKCFKKSDRMLGAAALRLTKEKRKGFNKLILLLT